MAQSLKSFTSKFQLLQFLDKKYLKCIRRSCSTTEYHFKIKNFLEWWELGLGSGELGMESG